MQTRRPPSNAIATVLFLLCLISMHPSPGHAQPALSPWSGIATDEARPEAGPVPIEPFTNDLPPRARSADGRFVVFLSRAALVAGDANSDWDVYLRDRQTGALVRVSAAPDGGDSDAASMWPIISADGRYVVFASD